MPVKDIIDNNLFSFVHAFKGCKLAGKSMEAGDVSEFGVSLHLFSLLNKGKIVSFYAYGRDERNIYQVSHMIAIRSSPMDNQL